MSDNEKSSCDEDTSAVINPSLEPLLRGNTPEEKMKFLSDTKRMYAESRIEYRRGWLVWFLLYVFFGSLCNYYPIITLPGLEISARLVANVIPFFLSLWLADGLCNLSLNAWHLAFLENKYGRDNLR